MRFPTLCLHTRNLAESAVEVRPDEIHPENSFLTKGTADS
jgi:hypothetical protein